MRVFCQYSYNGFATFRINEGERVKLIKVTPSDSEDGLPALADLYFNYGGVKLLYRYLNSDTLALIICGIPSPEFDTFDRPINCAVQFIGNSNERNLFDSLAKRIAENLDDFEVKFSEMFDLVGGLYFESNKLFSYINGSNNYQELTKHPCLSKLQSRRGEVLLFIPTSDKFGIDPTTTSKTLKELRLPREAAAADRCLRLTDLKKSNSGRVPISTNHKPQETDIPVDMPLPPSPRVVAPKTYLDTTNKETGRKTDSKKNKNQIFYLLLGVLLTLSLVATIIKLFF